MERKTVTSDQGAPENQSHLSRSGRNFFALRQVLSSSDLRRVLPGLAFSCFLSNILALALPLAILQIIDRVVLNRSVSTLVMLVVGVVLALTMQMVLRTTNGLVTSWLGTRFEHSASVAAFEHLMRVPLYRYQIQEPGTYVERILASSKVAAFYSGEALLVLFEFPFVFIFLFLIYLLGGAALVIVPILLLLVFGFVIYMCGGWMQKQVEQRNVLDDRRFGFLSEVLSGIHSVKTMSMESLMLRRYERLQETNSNLGEVLNRGNSLASNMGAVCSQIMIVTVVAASSWLVINGKMTPGSLAACMMLSVRTLRPLRRSLKVWLQYQSFVAAHERLNEIINLPCEDDAGKPVMPALKNGLELRNVSLSHEGGGELFRGLSCYIEAGQCVAIRGESGSGKTSLLALMSGFVRPNSGEVLIDGQPLVSFSSVSVHKEIAFLPQTGTIVSGNVLENLTMFDPSLNQEALRLAEILGLGRIVAGMKLGYETPLGEGAGDALSTGVSQIITIIRGLVHNPSIILFDEANISLDMRGDQLLGEYLARQKGKCTIVMVTHRPSLISLADKVYSLVNGTLVEGVLAMAPDVALPLATSAPLQLSQRPEGNEDMANVIRRQFGEESDLALCLLPLLTSLRWQGQPRELAEAMPHLVERMELSNLCSTMANIGFSPKQFSGNLARLDDRFLPCLFLPRKQPALVILKSLSNGSLLAFDSARRMETEITPSTETGAIYVFKRKEAALKSRQNELTWVGSMLLRFRGHIALAFFLSVAGAFLSLAPPLFVRSMYNRVLPSGDIAMGGSLMVGVVIAIALNGLLFHIKSGVMAFVSGRFEYILGNSIFQRIISLPTYSIEGSSVSNQVGKVKNLESLRDFFLGSLSTVAFELPANLVLVLAIGIINPWVLVVLVASFIAFGLLGVVSRKYSENSVSKSSQLASYRWEFLNEALSELRTIRSVGAGQSWVNRFREMSSKTVMANFRDKKMHSRVNAIAGMMGYTTGLLSLAVSAYLAIIGEITSGTMVATMMITWRLVGPIQNIFQAATSLARTRANIRQIESLMRLKGEAETGVIQTIRPIEQGTLSFARVSFRYASDADPVLLGVSFSLLPGKFMAIAGSNGSGKSTLLKLIERIYIPQAGTIRLGDVDIRQLTAPNLRAKISYMPQHYEFFYGTVAQNLRLANPVATETELQWAIDMAGLADDIKALPDGMHTRISNNRSEQLPHGFRQRLSLARTIVKPADLVLLDEPATGMDQSGEEALLRCIEWLRGRSTLIMVTHRPSHMRLTDTIIVMDRGSVVAMGAFDSVKDKLMTVIS